MENFPKDLAALFGPGQQQAQEFPLGQHGHPAELVSVQAQQVLHCSGDLPGAGDGFPVVGKCKDGIRLFLDQLVPPLGRAEILRVPVYRVFLPAPLEGQLGEGGGVPLGKAAAKHGRLSVGAAGLPVQGKGDAVKQRGLSGPCVTGDEIQPPLTQAGKVHGNLPGIGSEGR